MRGKMVKLTLSAFMVDRIDRRANELGFEGPYTEFILYLVGRGLETQQDPIETVEVKKPAVERAQAKPDWNVEPPPELPDAALARCGNGLCDARIYPRATKCWNCGRVFGKGP
jgi:hypothetical protein